MSLGEFTTAMWATVRSTVTRFVTQARSDGDARSPKEIVAAVATGTRGQLGLHPVVPAYLDAFQYGALHYCEMEAALASIAPPESQRVCVLDLGCASGAAGAALASWIHRVRPDAAIAYLGVDHNRAMRRIASETLARLAWPAARIDLMADLDDEATARIARQAQRRTVYVLASHVLRQEALPTAVAVGWGERIAALADSVPLDVILLEPRAGGSLPDRRSAFVRACGINPSKVSRTTPRVPNCFVTWHWEREPTWALSWGERVKDMWRFRLPSNRR